MFLGQQFELDEADTHMSILGMIGEKQSDRTREKVHSTVQKEASASTWIVWPVLGNDKKVCAIQRARRHARFERYMKDPNYTWLSSRTHLREAKLKT